MATIQFGNCLTTFANEEGNIQGAGCTIGTLADGQVALIINDTGANQGTLKIQGLAPGTSGKLGNPIPNVQSNYSRFYIQPITFPAANAEMFYNIIDVSDALKFNLRFDAAGHLQVYNFGTVLNGVKIDQTKTTLSLNTWYRLECLFGTGANVPYSLSVAAGDGQFIETISGLSNFGTSGGFEPGLGKDFNAFSQPLVCNVRDFLWSDSGLPGPGHCAVLVPVNDGFYQNGTPNGAATRWQCLGNPPDDDTTYVNGMSAGQAYTAQTSGGILGVIHSVKSYIRFRSDDGVTPITCNARLRVSGQNFDTPDVGFALQSLYTTRQRIFDNDPTTGKPWTSAAVNAAQVGFVNNAGPGRYTETCLMVDYLPSPPADLVSGLFLFALKGIRPFTLENFAQTNAAYLPSITLFGGDMPLDAAGLQAPFSLAYFKNNGNALVTVKDGQGGPSLATLAPGQDKFLIQGGRGLSLGQNLPALTGVSTVEYCLWK